MFGDIQNMKVLYIGHYKEFGGWAQAATDQILALDSVGVDVVCRNITLTADRQNIHPRLLALEQKDLTDIDYCIQHVLPHHLVGSKAFKKNIAFLEIESVSIKGLAWFDQLTQMDEIWVANQDIVDSLENDNIGVPVKLVHHATDINKYTKQYSPLEGLGNDAFKFYYAGDFNDRKNLQSIVTCFHSEFEKAEDACLIVKVKQFGKSKEELDKTYDDLASYVKGSIRMYRSLQEYKTDYVISDELSDADMCRLHNHCDCFLCPSHGEAWSIPSLDAMAFGNTPICSNFGGPKEFITEDENTGKLIDGCFSVCKSSDSAFPDMFTGREYWFQPCEKQIREQMRKYYESYKENPITHKQKAKSAGLEKIKQFSYENIGNKMLENLNA